SHFQDVTVDLRQTNFAPPAAPIHIGSDFAASRAFFGGFDARWGVQDLEKRLNHPTPATQFGIVLQGTFSITTTDGETRRLNPGRVFRLEDTSPCKGHITVVVSRDSSCLFGECRWRALSVSIAGHSHGMRRAICAVHPRADIG